MVEREGQAPDLLDVGQVLAEVREGATRCGHLHVMALRDQVLGDDAGARRVPEALSDGAVEDSHES